MKVPKIRVSRRSAIVVATSVVAIIMVAVVIVVGLSFVPTRNQIAARLAVGLPSGWQATTDSSPGLFETTIKIYFATVPGTGAETVAAGLTRAMSGSPVRIDCRASTRVFALPPGDSGAGLHSQRCELYRLGGGKAGVVYIDESRGMALGTDSSTNGRLRYDATAPNQVIVEFTR